MPLYLLGFMGASRRLNHYEASTGWSPLFMVASFGVALICIGLGLQLLQLYVSIRDREKNRDLTGDPWNGRTLEWSTSSPPPFYNFAFEPEVHEIDPFWEMKKEHLPKRKGPYEKIHMPKNTGIGVYIGGLSFLFGFAIIWYIFWLAVISGIGIIVCLMARLYQKETSYYVTPEEVEKYAR
jgi:cytochrome o ubiquinol oxidase subunit 1